MKPIYLYHGSQYLFDIVKPHAASGKCDRESKMAVYAAETIREVIPFALPIRWYPDNPDGKRDFKCNNGKTELLYGSLNPDGVGYVYKIKAEGFVKIDNWQWISEHETVPEEIIQINVRDYWNTVFFSEEARRINAMMYGERACGGINDV